MMRCHNCPRPAQIGVSVVSKGSGEGIRTDWIAKNISSQSMKRIVLIVHWPVDIVHITEIKSYNILYKLLFINSSTFTTTLSLSSSVVLRSL